MGEIIKLDFNNTQKKSQEQELIDDLINEVKKYQDEIRQIEFFRQFAYQEIVNNSSDIQQDINNVQYEVIEILFEYFSSPTQKIKRVNKDDLKNYIYYYIEKYGHINNNRTKEILHAIESQSEKKERINYYKKMAKAYNKKNEAKIDIADFLYNMEHNIQDDSNSGNDDFINFIQLEIEKERQKFIFDESDFFEDFNTKQATTKKNKDITGFDITSFYKNIVKQIHPDREKNPTIRAIKEKLMIELTDARNLNDIAKIAILAHAIKEQFPEINIDMALHANLLKQMADDIKEEIRHLLNDIHLQKNQLRDMLHYSSMPKGFTTEKIVRQAKKIRAVLKKNLIEFELLKHNLKNNPTIAFEQIEYELSSTFWF